MVQRRALSNPSAVVLGATQVEAALPPGDAEPGLGTSVAVCQDSMLPVCGRGGGGAGDAAGDAPPESDSAVSQAGVGRTPS